jgi:magnesium chelatase subunit D
MDISEQTRLAGVHSIVIVIETEVVGSSFMEMRLGYCKILRRHLVEDTIPSPV